MHRSKGLSYQISPIDPWTFLGQSDSSLRSVGPWRNQTIREFSLVKFDKGPLEIHRPRNIPIHPPSWIAEGQSSWFYYNSSPQLFYLTGPSSSDSVKSDPENVPELQIVHRVRLKVNSIFILEGFWVRDKLKRCGYVCSKGGTILEGLESLGFSKFRAFQGYQKLRKLPVELEIFETRQSRKPNITGRRSKFRARSETGNLATAKSSTSTELLTQSFRSWRF